MKYPINDIAPSDMFVDSISYGGGSHNMTCGYCGREHYCPDSDNFYHNDDDPDDEEDAYVHYLRDALEEQKNCPEGVIIHRNVDCVMSKDLNGMSFVVECPCNGLTKYENFIWENRHTIETYLKARTAQELQWANEKLTLNKLKGVLK